MNRERTGHSEDGENEHFSKKDVLDLESHERTAWSEVNFAGEQKRNELIESLKEFSHATGIDESKHIRDLKEAKSNGEIYEKEKKMQKAAVKWYEIQMQKSGIFNPMHNKESKPASQELSDIVRWFSDLSFSGDVSMISTLCRLKEDLEPQKNFRTKLKRQSKFVKDEYFRRLGSLPLIGSKEKLLEDVLKEIKEVEDSPSAVQFEFKKKQKSAGIVKKTADLKKEVTKGFEDRQKRYSAQILSNKEYFGGELKNSPYGKIPGTALEFLEWFDERKNFAEMDMALKDLPSLIKERKALFEERDEILEHAIPKDRANLTNKTDKMRRHELEAFLPNLREHVRRNSTHVAEYMSTIIGSRTYHVKLFNGFERSSMISKFQLASFDTQEAYLKILDEEIKDRDRVVREYFALDSYLRDDESFISGGALDREKILMDAKDQKNREKDSPFETEKENLDAADVIALSTAIGNSREGEKYTEEILKELKEEGELKAAKVQEETYWKIFGTAKRADRLNITQKESYLYDLKHWVRLPQHVMSEKDAVTKRQKDKIKYINAADEAHDMGYALTSGGVVHELQEINEKNLKDGTGDIERHLNRAKYGEHVLVNRADGSMAEDPLEMINRLSEKELLAVTLKAIDKLTRKHMGLNESNAKILKNSPNIQKELGEKFIDAEFTHMKAA